MQYLRRFAWFFVKRVFWITIAVGTLVIAFYMAMNTANITILLKDGMALRAKVIIMQEEPDKLTNYFNEDFINLDVALQMELQGQSPYKNYTITGIDHRIEMKWLWSWPWDDIAHADFVESVPKIDGRLIATLRNQQGDTPDTSPPEWRTAKYRATLIRSSRQWKIESIQLIEYIDQ